MAQEEKSLQFSTSNSCCLWCGFEADTPYLLSVHMSKCQVLTDTVTREYRRLMAEHDCECVSFKQWKKGVPENLRKVKIIAKPFGGTWAGLQAKLSGGTAHGGFYVPPPPETDEELLANGNISSCVTITQMRLLYANIVMVAMREASGSVSHWVNEESLGHIVISDLIQDATDFLRDEGLSHLLEKQELDGLSSV